MNLPADAIQRARRLRKNMTDAERALWHALREAFPGLHWRKQVPFGPYIADFCSHGARLIIELDGGQHATGASQAYDEERTRFLIAEGYRALRFWNHDILSNLDGVLQVIEAALPLVGRVGWGPAASAAEEAFIPSAASSIHPAADAAEPPTQPSPTRGEGSAE